MRQIKFRAWDAEAEYMIYSDKPEDMYFFEVGYDGILRAFRIDESHATETEPPHPISIELHSVHLFTGLKDKASKEIYDGDIVMAPTFMGGQYHKAVVKYEYDRFELVPILKKEHKRSRMLFYESYKTKKKCEIIGNIYENPELLEGEE